MTRPLPAPDSDDGIFDIGSGASAAAHDQAVAGARDALRTAKHFVIVAELEDGTIALGASAPFAFMIFAERRIHDQAARLLYSEFMTWREGGEDD